MRLIGINEFIKSKDKLFVSFVADEIYSNESEYLTTLLDKEYPEYKISERYHNFKRQYTLGYTTNIGIVVCNNGNISIVDKDTYTTQKGSLFHDKYVECIVFYDTSSAYADNDVNAAKEIYDCKGLTPINLVVNWRSNNMMKLIIDHKNKAVILMDGEEKVVVVCDNHDKFVPSVGFALVLSKYLDNKDLREVRKLFRKCNRHLDEKKYSAFVIGMLSNWKVSKEVLNTQYLNKNGNFKFAGRWFDLKVINKEEK